MFKDDQMLPLLTGVVIMLGLGILAQRSETVMAWLGEPTNADSGPLALIEDNVRVIRGKPTTIDVLANDIGLRTQDISGLAIASPPQCGIAEVAGGGIEYVATPSCGAQQAFSYRITTRSEDAFGLVRISVIDRNDPSQPEPAEPELVAAAPAPARPDLQVSTDRPSGPALLRPVQPSEPAEQPQVAQNQPATAPQLPNATPTQPQQAEPLTVTAPSATDQTTVIGQIQQPEATQPQQSGEQLALHQPAPAALPNAIQQPEPAPDLLSDQQPDRVVLPGQIATPSSTETVPSYENSGAFRKLALAPNDTNALQPNATTEAEAPTAPQIRQPELTVAMAIPAAPLEQATQDATPQVRPSSTGAVNPRQLSIASLGNVEATEAYQPLARDPVSADRLTPALAAPAGLSDLSIGTPENATTAPRFAALGGNESFASLSSPGPAFTDRDRVRLIAPETAAPAEPAPRAGLGEPGVTVAALSAPDQAQPNALDALQPEDTRQALPNLPPEPEEAPVVETPAVETAALTPTPEFDAKPEQVVEPAQPSTEAGDNAGSGGGFLGGLSTLFSGSDQPTSTQQGNAPQAGSGEEDVEVASLPQATEACVAEPALGISMQPAAQTMITIEAPCSPGRAAELVYDGMSFGVALDETGSGQIMALGLSELTEAKMTFHDGKVVEFDLPFSGINRVVRASLLWDMPVKLALHAIEFGGQIGSEADANPTNPRSYGDVRRRGGGFVTTFAPVDGIGQHANIYTHFIRRSGRAGVVDLMIDFVSRDRENLAEACGAGSLAKPSFKLLQSDRGTVDRPLAASLGNIACENVDTSGAALAKNLVGTMVIAP